MFIDPIRRTFEQYANVRPVRLMPGIQSPLVGRESGFDRFCYRPGECRRRILFGGRPDVSGHRVRVCFAAGREYPSMFEPVHGSAPDIAGRNIANPIGQIWSGAMMLEHLGETDAANAIVRAIESALQSGTMTRDIGGSASTDEAGKAIALAVESGV
jgi:isocitrate/isopropylmalate dehydrogenase